MHPTLGKLRKRLMNESRFSKMLSSSTFFSDNMSVREYVPIWELSGNGWVISNNILAKNKLLFEFDTCQNLYCSGISKHKVN